jgi:hypothetical protein
MVAARATDPLSMIKNDARLAADFNVVFIYVGLTKPSTS